MFRFLAALALCTGCASTLPQVESLDPSKVTAPIQEEIRQAQKSAQYTADQMGSRLSALREEVRQATKEAAAAVAEARRSVQDAAKKPPTIVREKVVPVADAVFRPGDRESLLSRAAEQAERLRRASEQLQDLAATMNDMQQQIDGLREFATAPASYVKTYGISGLLALLLSIAAYFTGAKKRR